MSRNVQQLQARHRRALQCMAIGEMSLEDVSGETGLSVKYLRDLSASPTGRAELLRLERILEARVVSVHDQLQSTAVAGARLIDDAVRNEVEGEDIPIDTRLKLSENALKRGGYDSPKTIDVRGVTVHTTIDELADIRKEVAKERKGKIEEAEIEVLDDSPTD